jgi:Na+/H+-dicarboxylate symporter
MTHGTRTIALGLILAYLVGYFVHWLASYEWFRPIGSFVGIVAVLIILRWMVGRQD